MNNVKYKEEILSSQIIEIKGILKNNYNWRSVLEVEDPP